VNSFPDRAHSLWLLRGFFALLLLAVACAYALASVWKPGTQPKEMSRLELRHWQLMQDTKADLQLDFSKSVSEPLKRWLPHRTDGVVQPLWPWVAAWIDGIKSPPAAGIPGGVRWFQLGLTLAFLLTLGLVTARNFTLPATLLVMLLIGFGGFLPTVGVFTGDALFQILFLLTWITCIYGICRNSLWVYGLAGGLGSLAYLTDERALPLLGVFLFVSTLRAVWEWLAQHWPHRVGAPTTQWHPRNHVVGVVLLIGLFAFITGPRMVESHQRFGAAFFHYQDRVRWLEDAAAAESWIQNHPDAAALARVPASAAPTLQNYLLDHSRQAVWERLHRGVKEVLLHFIVSGGGFVIPLALLLVSMAGLMPLATAKAQHAGQRLHPETVPAVFFVVLASAVYLLLSGWNAAVTGAAQRLLLLQPPLVLALIWGCESLRRRARRRQARPGFLIGYQVLLWMLVAAQSWQIIEGLRAARISP
jgi:MFS family permease